MIRRMTTPFGPSLSFFADKAAFYAAHPQAAQGWDWRTHPGSAPLGSDLFKTDRWFIVVCHPADADSQPGPTVAFDRQTGEIHLLAPSLTYEQAQATY